MPTTAEFIMSCKMRDITLSDLDQLNLGLVLEMINFYDWKNNPKDFEDDSESTASQADIDNTFG